MNIEKEVKRPEQITHPESKMSTFKPGLGNRPAILPSKENKEAIILLELTMPTQYTP